MKTFYVILYLSGAPDPQIIAAENLQQCLYLTRKAEANSSEAWCIIDADTKIPIPKEYRAMNLYDPKVNPDKVAKETQ